MKLVKPSFEIIEQKPGLEGIYEMIEMAGRTCYKSERKEGTTAKDFVNRMIASGHGAMLEHGTVYLDIMPEDIVSRKKRYYNNPYSRVYSNTLEENWAYPHLYVTTNYRTLIENGWLDDLKYLCEPTKFHEKRHTVRFITDIGIGRELLRHRVQQEDYEPEPLFSYANESTRYCNYSKDRFGNELTFVIPSWSDLQEGQYQIKWNGLIGEEPTVRAERNSFRLFWSLAVAERDYLKSLETGLTPQQARAVLPLVTKSELVMTGFESDWAKVFDLRVKGTTGKPHPDMVALMEPVMNEFINRGWYEV